MKTKALIVLEQPWWGLTEDPEQTSVLPFLQGLDRLFPDLRVYYASFFERNGFDRALQHLASVKERQSILYVASHGLGGRIGGMNLTTVLERISAVAKSMDIEGCLLGACEVGECRQLMMDAMVATPLNWIAGYSSSVAWLSSTLIDMNILASMRCIKDAHRADATKIEAAFASGLSLFNPSFELGELKKNGKTSMESLRASLSVLVKPSGRGHRPSDASHRIVDLAWPAGQ